ncbi:MAG: hypothetical protein M1816_000196 [Peltula sp. TS41687]|nr:MAG: hypothetical protein M1816_000196 [Peltula sp. TS41687]
MQEQQQSSPFGELKLPKNRSTGNLLQTMVQNDRGARIRFSLDANSTAEYGEAQRLPIMTEHEHGCFGASGLRRIRAHPPIRAPTSPSTPSTALKSLAGPRSSSMTLSLPSSRVVSASSAGPASPELSFEDDISRFPAESLHSFSFTHQSEEPIYSRQNLLRRSIEFIRDRPGWAASNAGIVNAQAKISGDAEAQSMIELLARAKLLGPEGDDGQGALGLLNGPMTGPAHLDSESVFENAFLPTSESPVELDELTPESPLMTITEDVNSDKTGSPGESVPCMTNGDQISASPTETTSAETTWPTKRSGTVRQKPPPLQRTSLKRTYTDISPLSLQNKLMEALAVPYVATDGANPTQLSPSAAAGGMNLVPPLAGPGPANAALHAHSSRWAPAAQAIFTTEASPPWTILAANDLACLVFGVTKAEVRKLGILEVVREERRKWLEEKLISSNSDSAKRARPPDSKSQRASPNPTISPSMGNGVTAQLLSKPSWRDRRAKTVEDHARLNQKKKDGRAGNNNHTSHQSRGVLLCGDVVPIQKRNGAIGAASLWVKEKRGGLIWVLEEITEDVAHLKLDDKGQLLSVTGASSAVWGLDNDGMTGLDVGSFLPCIPRKMGLRSNDLDYANVAELCHFTARNAEGISSPVTIEPSPEERCLRVSSFPHIAGMMVISASDLKITSSNSVFSAALFGQAQPDGLFITDLIPGFDRILRVFTEEDKVQLVDGLVLPEHSFRRARALLAIREGEPDAITTFLRPNGLLAKHRDGSDIKVDVQMRVVKSSSSVPTAAKKSFILEETEEGDEVDARLGRGSSDVMYALWMTYSRHLHATGEYPGATTPLVRSLTPPHQPSPGQAQGSFSPAVMDVEEPRNNGRVGQVAEVEIKEKLSPLILAEDVTIHPTKETATNEKVIKTKVKNTESNIKKTIEDFVILEDMGQGAYGQVKLARYKKNQMKKMVLKYVTKRRILVDTWTRDRRLGTVPLEIHVLDYLRHDGLRHPNIVEMSDFFEDDINYYIEMVPHGLPGMDLFDYIELRVNMEEGECRSIFHQVVNAVHHLHTKALVVHRDIKDENVVLDGEGNIKLIDFGSATYIKNGPFDVFVGTIDYAAPEVLAGHPYRGKEQDVWALGILLYTIVYKENPFYSIDEIMDHDLRVPYVMSEDCIDLIRNMLNRDLDRRIDIQAVVDHPWLSRVR